MIETKADLLREMSLLGACADARDYVRKHPSPNAEEIWSRCDRADWMCWLAGHLRPTLAAEFALRVADRAVRFRAFDALCAVGMVSDAAKLGELAPVSCAESAKKAHVAVVAAAKSAYAAPSGSYGSVPAAIYSASEAVFASMASWDAARRAERSAYWEARLAGFAVAHAGEEAHEKAYGAALGEQLAELRAMWPEIAGGEQ